MLVWQWRESILRSFMAVRRTLWMRYQMWLPASADQPVVGFCARLLVHSSTGVLYRQLERCFMIRKCFRFCFFCKERNLCTRCPEDTRYEPRRAPRQSQAGKATTPTIDAADNHHRPCYLIHIDCEARVFYCPSLASPSYTLLPCVATMRPTAALNEAIDSRAPLRKLSNPQIGQSTDRPSSTPISFFLARGQDFENDEGEVHSPKNQTTGVQISQETLEDSVQPLSRKISNVDHDSPDPRRRRSTIKARSPHTSRRPSSIHSNAPSIVQDDTPLMASLGPIANPSQDPSLPSSPDTRSSRSFPQSRASSSADENSSQAIVSSEDDEPELPSTVQDSAPQLIMPSIMMPSRRPFTQRGKTIGRCKIMVAGSRGVDNSRNPGHEY